MTAAAQPCLLLLLVLAVSGDEGITRQLNVTREWDTSCLQQLDNETCSEHPLAHVAATSQQDTVHVLVSLWAAPSCLLLRTPRDAQISINWTLLLEPDPRGAVAADGVMAAYGVSLDQLIEFDDPKDTADLRDASDTSLTPFAVDVSSPDRTLDVSEKTGEDGDSVVVRVKAPPLSAAGSVTFQVTMLNTGRRTEELPHLQQTGDSVVAGVVLDKLNTSSGFSHTRFGVQMTVCNETSESLTVTKSLDDEYTPGVFKLVSLSSPAGFLQWRPVAYTDPESTIEHSTSAREYGVQPAPGPPASPLLAAWFGPSVPGRQLNVTFGLSEDGWYKDTRYAAWELTVGLGAPPEDEFSLMVILLLGIGLGLPTVALIGGGVWMLVRRLRGQTPARASLLAEEE